LPTQNANLEKTRRAISCHRKHTEKLVIYKSFFEIEDYKLIIFDG
jgi:hypothetical protein